MSKKLLTLLAFVITLSLTLTAQKKELTIGDVSFNLYVKSYKLNPAMIQWRGDVGSFTYAKQSSIYEVSPKGNETILLTINDISTALEKKGLNKLMYLPNYTWINENEIQIINENLIFNYDVKKKQIIKSRKINENAENLDFDASYNQIAYTVENNLYLSNIESKEIQITKDEDKGIVNGKSVHRQEFGIEKGIFWSPKGNYIAFYRMDETMVTDYPLVDITKRVAEVENTKYPMAGMKSHHVTLGIYDIANNKTTFVKTGEPAEQYLTNIAWSPDEKSIYIAVLNREQNHMLLNQYNALTGDFVKTLFEEKHEKYVEPLHPVLFVKNNDKQFIWQSQRDGYNHLYLYNSDGKLAKQLTKGEFVVLEVLGFDDKGENLFFSHTGVKRAIETHVSSINLKTGVMTQITQTPGTHSAILNSRGTYFIDDFSSLDVFREIDLVSTSNKKVQKSIIKCENVFDEYGVQKPEIFTIKAADEKTDLYCGIVKPKELDETKKYPVIVYVYGGPHAQMINDTWLGGLGYWDYYMAQKGYIVMTIDNRGSANRGFEFENVIHRNLGVNEMADQMKGIDYLKTLPYVDMDRIGVHGWSFGGFMTTSLMVNYPDIFKVGVAGGPVIDWKYYEVMYGERYMDTPEENPEGYKNNCLVDRAKDLKGKLLLIHGAIDPTVVWQNSLAFIQSCIEEGVQVDYFVYPRAEHNVRGPHRIHLMEKVTQYFDDYLKK